MIEILVTKMRVRQNETLYTILWNTRGLKER
jgi:hypothetical protein